MRRALAALILATTGLVAACDRLVEVPISGAWQLEIGSLDGRPIDVPPGHRITLTVEPDRVGGQAACNHYGGTLEAVGSTFRIRELAGTAMGCPDDLMAAETDYLVSIGRVTTAGRADERLLLSGPGVELRFVRLPPVDTAGLIDTDWQLDTLTQGDVALMPVGAPAGLLLAGDGTLSGSTGCRPFSGRYILEADLVLVTQLSLAGECDPGVADQDAHLVEVIGDGFRPVIDAEWLTLHDDGSGRTVVYRQAL